MKMNNRRQLTIDGDTKESKKDIITLSKEEFSSKWREYNEIITDSLWIMNRRDNSGVHSAWYHGNFIPQIPHQMMIRYTKKNDWVLDPFLGGGTTLIECRRLGRNGIGIELNQRVMEESKKVVEEQYNKYNITTEIINGNSRIIDVGKQLNKFEIDKVQLLIMHPPYHDIIKFSDSNDDLSNAKDIEKFLKMFGEVVDNMSPYLEEGYHLTLVIGDKYANKEVIPLGFYCMQEILKRDYLLRGIVVKDFGNTNGKVNQRSLWRYRALANGFYIFKHEYIFLFKKV